MSSLSCNLDVKRVDGREMIGRDVAVRVGGGSAVRYGGRSDLVMFDQTDPPKFATVGVDRPTPRAAH
jgi:hypothetical protein